MRQVRSLTLGLHRLERAEGPVLVPLQRVHLDERVEGPPVGPQPLPLQALHRMPAIRHLPTIGPR